MVYVPADKAQPCSERTLPFTRTSPFTEFGSCRIACVFLGTVISILKSLSDDSKEERISPAIVGMVIAA